MMGPFGVGLGETEAEEGAIDRGHGQSLLGRPYLAGHGRIDSAGAGAGSQAAAIRDGDDRHIQNRPSIGSTAGT